MYTSVTTLTEHLPETQIHSLLFPTSLINKIKPLLSVNQQQVEMSDSNISKGHLKCTKSRWCYLCVVDRLMKESKDTYTF